MTLLNLETIEKRYKEYLDAEQKVLSGQRYKIENRELERASLEDIRKGLTYWENKYNEVSRGGRRGMKSYRAIPRDL